MQLIDLLNEWLDSTDINQTTWRADLFGRYLRKILRDLNCWKNAPRGNPAKGHKVKLAKEKEKRILDDSW